MTYYRNPASWETIFSKSSENVDEVELNCKDCLLIVYQFAAEAKNASQVGERENEGTVTQRYLKGIIVIFKE
jgi:tubulin polyglutamylase TTLL7